MRKIFLSLLVAGTLSANAYTPQMLRMHCDKDSTEIEALLSEGKASGLKTAGDLMAFYGEKFVNRPYVAHTLESDDEYLTINIDEVDCTTFVESLTALTRCTLGNRRSWRDYANYLENIRYKNGELKGYASRLHYISAWIIDNAARGNLREVSGDFERASYIVKTLNFMTKHRDKYDALKDSMNYEGIKMMEIGFYSHRFPFIKKGALNKKDVITGLKDGDIIGITTKVEGLDTSHMGIIKKINGVPHLLHASMGAGKVIIDPLPLYEMLNGWRSCTGIRVIRLTE